MRRERGMGVCQQVAGARPRAVTARAARALCVALALGGALFPVSALAAPYDTIISSRTTGEGAPDGTANSYAPAISGDGRFVAFVSSSPRMTPDDPTPTSTSTPDAYVRDHQRNETTLVSVGSTSGVLVDGTLSITPDGRYVVFSSSSNRLAAGDEPLNGNADLYVRDMQSYAVELVTPKHPQGGAVGQDPSTVAGAISADGRYVAFSTRRGDLVPNDTNNWYDVFVRDLQSDTTTLVARTTYRANPSLSADGRYLAFVSDASLVEGDTNGKEDVFVRDLQANTTTLVSRAGDGSLGNNHSRTPSISTDGRSVAFHSSAGNLVEGATQGGIFLRDQQAGTTTLVSRARDDSAAAVTGLGLPSLSADGRFVAFESGASNLVWGDNNGKLDVFVRDVKEGITAVVSRSSGAGVPNGDLGSGTTYSTPNPISADGRFVSFDSGSTNLVPGDTNFREDVFRRALGKVAATYVSVSDTSVTEGDAGEVVASFTVSLSGPNGRQVTLDYASADETATAGADYVMQSGNLSFAPGDTEKTVNVTVNGDMLDEPDERLLLRLSNPVVATVADGEGAATITDDDSPSGSAVAGAPLGPVGLAPGGAPLPDRLAPRVLSLSLTPGSFSPARTGPSVISAGRGPRSSVMAARTRVSYRLSEPAGVTFSVQRPTIGQRRGRLCAAQRRTNRPAKRCTRWVALAGSFSQPGRVGQNSFSFSGRLANRALPRGAYRLVAIATDHAGNRSAPTHARFRIR